MGSVLERGKLELTAGIWDEGDVGDQGAVEAEGRDREENGPDAAQASSMPRTAACAASGAAAAPASGLACTSACASVPWRRM